jgi:phytoene synthase
MDIRTAYAQCTELARSHYENFPVGLLVPKHLRHHVHAVYAFARVADDFADEGYDNSSIKTERRLEQLNHFEDQLSRSLKGQSLDAQYEWIFTAVADTRRECQVPVQLFYDLLSAFKQDVVQRRYQTFDQVLDYCRRSANPVGRLVLHLHGLHDDKRHKLSDYICTALQLANFWQDVGVDLDKDRVYLPLDDMEDFGLTEAMLKSKRPSPEFLKCLRYQVERTWEIFHQGKALCPLLQGRLAWEIRATWLGGTTILEKIATQDYDTLSLRPKLSKLAMLGILTRSFFSR